MYGWCNLTSQLVVLIKSQQQALWEINLSVYYLRMFILVMCGYVVDKVIWYLLQTWYEYFWGIYAKEVLKEGILDLRK